jgi:2-polyprenyl-3-methyl-5-hydroxy-6-metoxy-1,4-benzoquinol methylase
MDSKMYESKTVPYFNAIRVDLLEILPRIESCKLLEIGAGTGATLLAAKKMGIAHEVVGIELMEVENHTQNSSEIDRFIFGDIQSLDLEFDDEYFDVIFCADVLEHLVDPWQVIQKLSRYLKPGGLFISSIPNVRNYTVLREIIFGGSFAYKENGILDKTHMRFFCRKNLIAMFEEGGYEIEKINTNMGGYGFKHKLANAMTFGLMRDFFVLQYVTLARKIS